MPDLMTIARWLVIFGLVLAAIGGLLWLAGKAGLPLGRLPGDVRIQSGGFTCLVPLASSIVISLILTLLLNVVIRWLGR